MDNHRTYTCERGLRRAETTPIFFISLNQLFSRITWTSSATFKLHYRRRFQTSKVKIIYWISNRLFTQLYCYINIIHVVREKVYRTSRYTPFYYITPVINIFSSITQSSVSLCPTNWMLFAIRTCFRHSYHILYAAMIQQEFSHSSPPKIQTILLDDIVAVDGLQLYLSNG